MTAAIGAMMFRSVDIGSGVFDAEFEQIRGSNGRFELVSRHAVVVRCDFNDKFVVCGAWVRIGCRHSRQSTIPKEVSDGHAVRTTQHREFEGHGDEGQQVLNH